MAGALQQARVKIEHVTGISFASRWTAQQQRDLAIGDGVLGKIVVDAQRVPLGIAEIFAHGAGSVGRDVLHGRGIGRRGRNDDGVIHRAVVVQGLHHLRDRGALLPDGAINADQVAALTVDDGVERDRGLAGLAIADDQFALAAADRNHRVDGLQSGGHRLTYRLAVDDAGRQALNRNVLIGIDRSLVVDGQAKRIDYAADHGVADGHAHDAAGALDLVALFDFGVFAHQHHAYLVFFQVHGDAGHVVRELEQFARHDLVEAVDAGDTVADRHHRADFVDRDLGFVIVDLLADELSNLVCFDLCHKIPFG